MRKFIISTITLFIVHLNSVLADFYVIPIGANVGTEIKSLPYTISEPGFYYLKKNLSLSALDTEGITIEANDVTIDLLGHVITGPGKASGSSYSGIRSSLYKNIEIRNGTITQFGSSGIDCSGSSHRAINMRIHNNGYIGIRFASVDTLVDGCTVSENGDIGIFVNMSGTVSASKVFSNSSYGIYTGQSSNIINNTAYDNGADGIYVDAGSYVSNNTAYDNASDGIDGNYGCTIIGNTAYANDQNGIECTSGCTIKNNTAYYNTDTGINISGNNNLIHSNTAYDNDSSGSQVQIDTCSPCRYVDNYPDMNP